MKSLKTLLTIFFILQLFYLQGQSTNRQKSVYWVIDSCQTQIDSFTIAPSTLTVYNLSNNSVIDAYTIENTTLSLPKSVCSDLQGDTLFITYRTFDFNIGQTYFHLDSTLMKVENKAIYIGSDYSFAPKQEGIIDSKGLDYNGSFSRGFSVGNNQSLVLNSNFNLQLAGDLGNGINIVAAISDDNIPIQPEGNTQLIQEFDRVFIKVSKDETSVIAGDYALERPKSYFLNYFKKLEGISAANTTYFNNHRKLSTDAHFAVSRGKFARQQLNVTEGNQGPYKLTGNNGERFLIVLSGSEKIYLDGQLLTRGLENDYIIDYNRAEITFTPSRLIGRESRIIVEYEYRDQNYLRSVYAANTYFQTKNWDVNFNFYNEQDSKSSTGDIVLDSFDLLVLSQVGDNIEDAKIRSFRPVTDTATLNQQITYRLNTNVLPGDTDNFFLEYSTNRMEELYVASFTEVGENQGRYIIDEDNLVNGRVYKYVGPNNGKYDPITQLTPPEKKQNMSLGATWKPKENTTFRSELSLSNTDINRYASRGNEDNVGLAGVFQYDQAFRLDSARNWTFTTTHNLELLDENYRILNPYRTAEFARNWNIQNRIITGQQTLLSSEVALAKKDSIGLAYNFELFDLKDQYQGLNHELSGKLLARGFSGKFQTQLLNSEGFDEKTEFFRNLTDISQKLFKNSTIKVGAIYDAERNIRKNTLAQDSLSSISTGYDLIKLYFNNSKDKVFHYQLNGSKRLDYFPNNNALVKSIETNEYKLNTTYTPGGNYNLNLQFGWRDFQVTEPDFVPEGTSKSKKTLIGKFDQNFKALHGLFIGTTTYIINSGQEPKTEYFYEKVETGQGDYIYIGNPDSTLINANFRYAPDLGTANYIRLTLINNEFITTNNQSISQSLRIEPAQILREKDSKGAKFLKRFASIHTFRVTKKTEDQEGGDNGFFNFSTDSPNLVSYTSLINNTLFYNRGNPQFDLQLGNKSSQNIYT